MELPIDASHKDTTFRRYYKRLMPDLQKTKNRATTATVFSFLAVSLFAWFAVKPTAQTIIYLQREIKDKTELNQKMEDKITALIEAQSTYETVQNRLFVLEQALPHNPDGVLLANQLNQLIYASGASISALQVGSQPLVSESTPGAKLVNAKPIESYAITTVISGNYQQIRSFITGLLQLRRITNLESVVIRPIQSQVNDQSSLEAVIQLQSFYSTQ